MNTYRLTTPYPKVPFSTYFKEMVKGAFPYFFMRAAEPIIPVSQAPTTTATELGARVSGKSVLYELKASNNQIFVLDTIDYKENRPYTAKLYFNVRQRLSSNRLR